VQREEDNFKSKHPRKQTDNPHSCDEQVVQFNTLLELFLRLLKGLKLRDEWVLGLVDVSLGSFFVDGLRSVQLIALRIVTWVCLQFNSLLIL
jgi:hypothetical protein